MINKHYAVHDLKAGHFLNAITFTTDAEAIRWFTTMVNGDKTENNIARHPNDYMLFYMYDIDNQTGHTGTWDNINNKMGTQESPKELIMGASCIEPENKAFTINELVGMLKIELAKDNVTPLKKEA